MPTTNNRRSVCFDRKYTFQEFASVEIVEDFLLVLGSFSIE